MTHTGPEKRCLTKKKQDDIKDIGGFVGGQLKDGRRLDTNVLSRSLVTLDVDYAPDDFWDEIDAIRDHPV